MEQIRSNCRATDPVRDSYLCCTRLVFAHLANPAMAPFHMLLHVGALPARMFAVALLQGLDGLSSSRNVFLRCSSVGKAVCLSLRRPFFSRSDSSMRMRIRDAKSPYSQWNACS